MRLGALAFAFSAALLFSACGKKEPAAVAPVVANPIVAEDPKTWPHSVDEAATRIIASLSEKDKKLVRETPYEDLIKFHLGWGMGIRNGTGLWRGNDALLKDTGKQHPDDASMVIIQAIWKRLQNSK